MIARTPRPVLPEPEPGDPHWFATVEEAAAQDPTEHTAVVQQIVMGGHRLRAARDVHATFPKDYDRYEDLRWVDLRIADLDRCEDVFHWMVEQTWHGHFGFGWTDEVRALGAPVGCFGLFNDARDAVFFKMRWS